MNEHRKQATDATLEDEATVRRERLSLRRVVPLFVLLAGFVAFFAFGLDEYVTFETLREKRLWLSVRVAELGPWAAVLFVAAYACAIAFSVPGGLVLTMTGGFLFGPVFGWVYSVTGATIGATVVFVVARSALGDFLRQRAGPWLGRMERGFRENAMSYLLVLRLIPVLPFWVVNLVPAFLGVPLRTYVLATALGIAPAGFVFSLAGAGLGGIFDRGETFTAASVLTPEIVAALAGLAILALLPVVYGRIRAHRDSGGVPADRGDGRAGSPRRE